MNYSELMHAAALVRENAYAPYSGFKSGSRSYLENRAKFMSVVTSKMRLFPLPTVPSEQLFSRLSPRGSMISRRLR